MRKDNICGKNILLRKYLSSKHLHLIRQQKGGVYAMFFFLCPLFMGRKAPASFATKFPLQSRQMSGNKIA
jgi:hypothetical protein